MAITAQVECHPLREGSAVCKAMDRAQKRFERLATSPKNCRTTAGFGQLANAAKDLLQRYRQDVSEMIGATSKIGDQ